MPRGAMLVNNELTSVAKYKFGVFSKDIKLSRIMVVALILIFLAVGGLLSIRLYALNLEYQLARLEEKVTIQEEINLKLEKKLATLVSPGRVFDYAKAELGMNTNSYVDIVRIKNNNGTVLAAKNLEVGKNGNQTNINSTSLLAKLLNFVTEKAFAR